MQVFTNSGASISHKVPPDIGRVHRAADAVAVASTTVNLQTLTVKSSLTWLYGLCI